MTAPCSPRHTCRLCHTHLLPGAVFSLPPTPPANAFPLPGTIVEQAFPLDLYLCSRCGNLQLGVVVDPAVLFTDYLYVSPPGMKAHWQQHVEACWRRFECKPGDLVLEIGSNNGDLLREYQQRGANVLGFEPAKEIAAGANAAGIPTVPDFFTTEWVKREIPPSARVPFILANNVMAHIDDLDEVISGVKTLLAPDGVFIFEVQYLYDLVEKCFVDMIYHEHVNYHGVYPLVQYFARHGLHLFDVERIPTHGGSIRCYVERRLHHWGSKDLDHVVGLFSRAEREAGLYDPETYRLLHQRVDAARGFLHALVEDVTWANLNAGGKGPTFAGYGAPAKSTTLLHALPFPKLAYVVDDEPRKQGRLTPGTGYPIVPFSRLMEDPPNYLVIFAWNYADPIMDKVRIALGRRTPKFILPLPEPRIVDGK